MLVVLIASIINLLVFAIVLSLVTRLERIGCECALDWRRSFIEGYAKFLIVANVFNVIVLMFRPELAVHPMPCITPISLVFSAFGLAYIIVALQYLARLKRAKCSCSESTLRNLWQGVVYVQAALVALGAVMLVLTVVVAASLSKRQHARPPPSRIRR